MKHNWQYEANSDQPALEQILQSRGMSREMLHRSLADLPDESLLPNIEVVAQRITDAMYRNEAMIIFAHDDPDGITSAYILYRFLESIGYQKHHYYIPNRNVEQHGIQSGFLANVEAGHYPLVVTVDNGISAFDGVAALNALGSEVIITDHHLIQPDQLPNAYAILNPQLPESDYPYKMLAGVGVVLMLIRYMGRMLEHPVDSALYFWAAVGSLADKVPMTDVNWIIVRYVLDNWDKINDYSIDFLMRNHTRINTLTDKFNFLQYCSRLIANGREENGQHVAMRFLLQYSDEKAHLFQKLEDEKNTWEAALNNVFRLVDTMVQDYEGDAFIYYDDEDLIPYSLLGTAATYVVNNLDIPAIFLKNRHGVVVCEGRCNHDFNMVSAFTFCKDYLIQFGGHAKAAGFTMQHENYNTFIDCFHEFLDSQIDTDKQKHSLMIDAILPLPQNPYSLWVEIEQLIPFGQENPEPVVVFTRTNITKLTEKYCLDNASVALPQDGTWDVVVQMKSMNMVKVLDYHIIGQE